MTPIAHACVQNGNLTQSDNELVYSDEENTIRFNFIVSIKQKYYKCTLKSPYWIFSSWRCFHYRPCNFYNLMNRIKKKWLFIWLNSKLHIWDREIVHLFILIAPYLHPQPLNKWNWKRNWMIVLANFGFSHNFTTLFIKWPQFDFWTEKMQIPDYRFPIEWNDIVLLFCFCWDQQQQK